MAAPFWGATIRPLAEASDELRGGVANSLGRDLGRNVGAQRGDAAANSCHNNDAQANDGCGQNNPVNGYSASFVICEGFEDVQEFHDVTLSQGLL